MSLKTLLLLTLAATSLTAQAEPADSTVYRLSDVVVTGTRNAADSRQLPTTVTVISREALTEQHQINILPTLAEQVPGLFVTSRAMMGYGVSGGGSGAMNIRGISSGTAQSGAGQLMVLIDGHPHYQGLFGHTIADSYQSLLAERVEVLRGPASVLYGSNAMGGVVNIITRQPRQDGVNTLVNIGAGSYGTLQADATNQVRSGRFSSTLAAHYNRSDNHRPHMEFEQFGGYAKVGYQLSSHWDASADIDLTRFIASYPGSTTSPLADARQWITRGIASVAVSNHYDTTDGGLSLYYTFGNHKINDGHAPADAPKANYFRSEDALMGATWYQSARLFRGNNLTVGIDYQHIYGRAWNQVIATGAALPDMVNRHENEIAGYVDFRQDLTPWLTLDAGMRLDHHSQAGSEWVPQAGIVLRPTDNGELKATVGKGFRNPTIREMYLFGTKNANLKAERLMNYELAWTHRLGNLSYGINIYYIKGDNIILNMPFDGGRRFLNSGDIENCGAELTATYRLDSRWSLSTNHSLLHMEQPVIAAPEYKGYLGASYRRGPWTVVAGLQYINGLYTAVGSGSEQKENFCLLNASVNYQVAKPLTLWLRGENLLAQDYEINLGYPMPRATVMAGITLNL